MNIYLKFKFIVWPKKFLTRLPMNFEVLEIKRIKTIFNYVNAPTVSFRNSVISMEQQRSEKPCYSNSPK